VNSSSPLIRLTPAELSARLPDWSPDGKKIAFSTHCCNPQNEEIWSVNPDGGGLQLTKNGNDCFAGPHDSFPSWSPEGDAIVFERDAPDLSSSAIFVMKADGSGCKKLMSLGNSTARVVGVEKGAAERDLASAASIAGHEFFFTTGLPL